MAHTMKLWERFIDRRIREIVELDDIQFGFRKGRSTTEPIFTLRILQEKYREKGKYLHMVFVDLERRSTEYQGTWFGGRWERREFQSSMSP